jgi:hypothetical protein
MMLTLALPAIRPATASSTGPPTMITMKSVRRERTI